MRMTMMRAMGVVALLAILGGADAFKWGAKPAPPAPAIAEPIHEPTLFAAYDQQQQLELGATKGGSLRQTAEEERRQVALVQAQQPQPLPLAPQLQQQPFYVSAGRPQQQLAYVLIRPIQVAPFFQEQPHLVFRQPDGRLVQSAQPAPAPAPLPVKGASGELQVAKQTEVVAPVEELPPAIQEPPQGIMAKGGDKFIRLRGHLEKLKAKLSLGSSYHVQSEEIVPPPPPPQPIIQQQVVREPARPFEQQQVKQGHEEDIRLTQQEQERIRDAERQEQHQIQAVEQEKLKQQQEEFARGEQQQQLQQQVPLAAGQQEQLHGQQDDFDRRQQHHDIQRSVVKREQ